MAFVIRRREIVCVAASAAALPAGTRARAEGKTGSGVYPVAVPTYEIQFVAQAEGLLQGRRLRLQADPGRQRA